jgi:hypothetical protein
MSDLIHKADGGFMRKHENGVKCQKCGYFLEKSQIRSAYLNGKISLPFNTGPASMKM